MRVRDVYEHFDSPAAPTSYFLVDRLAAPLVYLNVRYLRVHPNVVSILSGLFVMLTLHGFFHREYVLGAIFYFVAFLLDSIDGPSARAMKKTTKLGVVLEVWFDSIRLIGSSFAIAWNLFEGSGNPVWIRLFLLWSFSFGAGVWLYAKLKEWYKEEVLGKKKGYSMAPVVTWIDLEMFAFFFCPILGCLKFGYSILSVGYLLTTVVMSFYVAFPKISKRSGREGKI